MMARKFNQRSHKSQVSGQLGERLMVMFKRFAFGVFGLFAPRVTAFSMWDNIISLIDLKTAGVNTVTAIRRFRSIEIHL